MGEKPGENDEAGAGDEDQLITVFLNPPDDDEDSLTTVVLHARGE